MACLRSVAVACLLFLPHVANAGAWPQKKGEGQIITRATAYKATGGVDDNGLSVPGARFERLELSVYVEYGLNDYWTVGFQPRVQSITSSGLDYDLANRGPGDIDFFVRRLVGDKGPWVAALQGLVKVGEVYDAKRSPMPGNGALELEVRGALGRSISEFRFGSGYISLEAGYRMRPQYLADQVRVDAIVGWRIADTKYQLLAESLKTLRVGAGRNDYEVLKAQLSVARSLPRGLVFQIGATSEYAGRKIGLGDAAFVSIWLQF